MSMMLRALTLFLLLSSVTVAAAQGDNDCQFELLDLASAMSDADKAIVAGDAASASAALDLAQALIDEYRARCVDTLVQSSFTLTETYRAPGGVFSLRYPEGWEVFRGSNDMMAIGSPNLDLESLADNPSELVTGEIILVLQMLPGSMESADDTAREFAEDVREGQNSIFNTVEIISPAPTNTLPAVRVEAVGDDVAASIDIVEIGHSQDEESGLLFMGVVSVADEAAQARALLDAVSATMEGAETAAPTLAPLTGVSMTGIGYDDFAFSTTQNLLDLDIAPVGGVALSPDGTRLARMDSAELCILTLANMNETCIRAPEDYFPPELSWSPDGRYIAGTADFYRLLIDPDVLLFDTVDERFSVLTEDGVERVRLGEIDSDTLLDIGITWAQDSQSLYLYRHIPSGDDGLRGRQGLYRLPLDGSDAELLVDLTPALGNIPYVFFSGNASLDGMMALSPDGTQLAFVVYGPGDDSLQNGVWVYNLETDDLDPIVPANALVAGLNFEFADAGNITPIGLSWSPDGGLYIHTTAGYRAFSLTYYDPELGDLIQINDPSAQSNQTLSRSGIVQGTPAVVAPLPNRDGVVYAAPVGDGVQIVRARAANGDVQSDVMLTLDDEQIMLGRSSPGDVGADGTMLLGWLLLLP